MITEPIMLTGGPLTSVTNIKVLHPISYHFVEVGEEMGMESFSLF
jgi:hypothetical protein